MDGWMDGTIKKRKKNRWVGVWIDGTKKKDGWVDACMHACMEG